MIDRERILSKIAELEGYLGELQAIVPDSFEAYCRIEKKRACERLLQISIEAMIGICHLLVTGMRLGLAGEESDLFEKLGQAGVLSGSMKKRLKRMKGLRNILVHEYGEVDNLLIYEVIRTKLNDIQAFNLVIIKALEIPQK